MSASNLVPTPTARVSAIRDEFDRFLERFLYPSTFTMQSPAGLLSPSVDLSETEKQYTVRLEAPGVAKDHVEIKLEGDLLSIRGERKRSDHGKDEQFVWQEREEGSFMRSLRMPTPVDAKGVTATMENGILTVTLPKTTPAASSRIPVK